MCDELPAHAPFALAPRLMPGGSEVNRTVRGGFWPTIVLGLAVILGSLVAPLSSATVAQGTPVAGATIPGSLPDMLAHLPNLPLAQSDATITYANLSAQAAANGVAPTTATAPDDEQRAWVSAMMSLFLPSSAQHWLQDEWVEATGFDVHQVEQAIEYAAPPLRVTVLRGSFDANGMREAWGRAGYQPIDLRHGEAYAIRDDFAIDINDPISRRVLASMNVLALTEDGVLIAGSDRASVAGALAAAAGMGPSLIERPDVGPLAATAPDDLATALLLPGTFVQFAPDVASAVLEGKSLDSMATRAAAEQAEAQRMPPVGSVLLGLTAGHAPDQPGETPAQVIAALSVGSAAAGERGAMVVTERLDTGGPPPEMRGGDPERSWATMFPQRSVEAVADEGVVLVIMTPAAETSLTSLPFLVFSRALTFMAW